MSKIIRPSKLVKEYVPIGKSQKSPLECQKKEGSHIPSSSLSQRESAKDVDTIISSRLALLEEKFQKEKEQAYQAGFLDGKKMGEQEGKKQGEDISKRFFSLLEDLKIQKHNLLKEAERTVVDLSLAIASKVIRSKIEADPQILLSVVDEAMKHLVDKEEVVIKVHPQDLEMVKENQEKWVSSIEGIKNLTVKEDKRIRAGGCLIETNSGNVDARLDSQLEVIAEALKTGFKT